MLLDEIFNFFITLNHKTQSRDLTRAIRDQLLDLLGIHWPKPQGLESRESSAESEIQLASNVDSIADSFVGLNQVVHGSMNGSRRHVGELCSVNGNIGLDSFAHVDNLISNVFSFSIAIGPDYEAVARSNFPLKRLLDLDEVLRTTLDDWRFEKLLWVDGVPVSVNCTEVVSQQVAGNGREDDFCLLAAKVHLELVDFVELGKSFSLK